MGRVGQGGDPINFFTTGWDLKLRLKVLGEEVSDPVYLDIMLSGLTKAPEFKFIREMHYRDNFTSVDSIQATADRFFVDQQSRNASGPMVSGRGAAMAVASDTDGHFQRNCTAKVAAPASASSTSSVQDHQLPSGFFGALMATHAELSLAPFRSDGSSVRIVVDSGATDNYLGPGLTPGLRAHMRDVEHFRVPHTIVAAGRHVLKGVATGTIFGAVTDDNGNDQLVSFRVILVPGLGTNLFSVTLAMLNGVATLFHPDNPRLESGDVVFPMQTLGVDTTTGKCIYSIEVKLRGEPRGRTVLEDAPDALAWKVEPPTVSCARSSTFPSTPLAPLKPTALGGFKYVTKFVDQQTKWAEIVLMKDKTCSVDSLALFNKGTVVPTGERIHCLRGDPGTEFTSAEFRRYCQDIGIKLEFASPNTPQQIGANERAGRTILNVVRSLQNGTLYKALYGKDAYLGHNRVIGSRAFVHEETHTRKLEHLAWEGRLVGYSTDSKSYRIYNSETRRARVSRNFVFIETPPVAPALDEGGFDDGEFTYDNHDDMELLPLTTRLGLLVVHLREVALPRLGKKKPLKRMTVRLILLEHLAWEGRLVGYSTDSKSYRIYNSETRRARVSRNFVFIETPPVAPALDEGGFDDGEFTYDNHDDMVYRLLVLLRLVLYRGVDLRVDAVCLVVAEVLVVDLREEDLRGEASRRVEVAARQVEVFFVVDDGPRQHLLSPGRVRACSTQRPSASSVVSPTHLPRKGSSLTSLIGTAPLVSRNTRTLWRHPNRMFHERSKRQGPCGTERSETQLQSARSRVSRNIYKAVPRTAVPPGRKREKSKWVFKRKAGGSFKRRLVAQGWNQVPGLDCGSTYAPPCNSTWSLFQMDLSTAFLCADILENVLVEQPPGFEVNGKDGGDLVMQLQKSLYGLAQSPSNWFHTIDPFLVEIGFVPLQSDTCVYLYDHDDVQVFLTLYVDDLLLAGNNANVMLMIKNKLKQRSKMTDMGEVKLVLGMEIKRDRNQGTLTTSQEAYSKSILERFGMSERKPTSTPGYGSELSNKQPEDTLLGEEETRRYQGIMGCLMYIAQVLRYDIMYATGQLARPMTKPSKIHMVAAKHTLRYVAGTTDLRTRTTEKLIASVLAMKEAVFCSNMVSELGFGKEFAQVPLYCDNTATLHALGNRSFSSSTKRIALRFLYIRELVSEGRMSIHYIPTDSNIADIGTKHLNKHRLKHLLDNISSFNVNNFISDKFK
ncbi:unnamed protein product [Ectocarpus sp. CCAP 1310/34]|nr:unnamed protein product [Ectocarpus sp. CCAP 1310/34]